MKQSNWQSLFMLSVPLHDLSASFCADILRMLENVIRLIIQLRCMCEKGEDCFMIKLAQGHISTFHYK